jgi:hypothetical protein
MTSFDKALKQILDDFPGWEAQDSSVIVCPCGHQIELDGTCPNGHASPLLELGFI